MGNLFKIDNYEQDVFSVCNYWKCEAADLYYVVLVYIYLSGTLQTRNTYLDGYMGVTVAMFQLLEVGYGSEPKDADIDEKRMVSVCFQYQSVGCSL